MSAIPAGTAYVDVVGKFDSLNKQIAGQQGALTGKFGKMGKAAGLALAGGVAAAGIGKLAYDLGAAFDDAYDTIRVGTGATGKALDSLKGSFKNVVKGVPTDFKSASAAVADINTRLGLTGKPLESLSKQFLELSRITETDVSTNVRSVTRAFGDWQVKTKDQSKTLDLFFRAAQGSGATVDELAQQVVAFGAPLRQVGFSLEEATAMFAQFEKAGVNTQTMMPGLKFALKTFYTEGREPGEALRETFKGIADGTIDTSAALKIFGQRAGADMVEAIRQGRFSLDGLTKSLVDGKETIRGAGRDTMDFAEHWQLFKNRVLVKLEPIAIRVFDGIGKMMVVLPPIAERVVTAVRGLLAPFVAVGRAVAENKTAFLAIAAAGSVLTAAFVAMRVAALVPMIPVIYSQVAAWVALRVAMMANPIGLIVTALAALAAGLVVAYRESEVFRKVLDGAFKGVSKAFGWILDAAQNVFGWLKSNWPTILAILVGPIGLAVLAIAKHWDAIKSTTAGAVDFVKRTVGAAWEWVRNATSTAWSAITSVLSSTWAAIRSAAVSAWGLIRDAIMAPIRAARDLIADVVTGIGNRLSSGWSSMRSAASSGWAAIRDAILTPIRAARDTVQAIIGGLRDWLADRWDTIAKQAGTMRDKFVAVFDKMGDAVRPVKNLIGDVVDAVKDAISWLGKIKVPKINLPDLNPFGGFGNGTTVGPSKGPPASVDGFNALAARFGNVVTSGYRPGDDGWHGQNRARDYAGGNMGAFARAMMAYAPNLLELIYTPLGVGVKNGSIVPISFFGSGVMADHYDHVHVAMESGGVVERGGWAVVGERGPELAHFPGGSTVFDAVQTAGVLGSDGSAVRVIFEGVPVEIQRLIRVQIDDSDRAAHAEFMAGVA